jgi:hypothetical protein
MYYVIDILYIYIYTHIYRHIFYRYILQRNWQHKVGNCYTTVCQKSSQSTLYSPDNLPLRRRFYTININTHECKNNYLNMYLNIQFYMNIWVYTCLNLYIKVAQRLSTALIIFQSEVGSVCTYVYKYKYIYTYVYIYIYKYICKYTYKYM